MKQFGLLVVAVFLTVAGLRAGQYTEPVFFNNGYVAATDLPQIDAYGFINLGTFYAASDPAIYDFMNVLDYTNRGEMVGYPGFRFDCTDDYGVRRPTRTFHNSGTIMATEGSIYLGYSNMYSPNYIQIRATNVVSPGLLSVMNAGNLRIEGSSVNLTRARLSVESLQSSMLANSYVYVDDIPVEFSPDNAVYDLYWGTGVQDPPPLRGPINTRTILQFTGQGVYANAPGHYVTDLYGEFRTAFQTFVPIQYNTTFAYTGVVGEVSLVLTNYDGTISNISVPTNIYRQAVVVGLSDTNIQVRTKFSPGSGLTAFNAVAVELSAPTTNIMTDSPEINSIYFVDYLADETNLVIVANNGVLPPVTSRPFMYEIWRTQPPAFMAGYNFNSELFRSIVYDMAFSNILATNYYAGYMASVDYLQSRPPESVPGATPTNLPGRIDIFADTLDLSMARIRGMGAINIHTDHLKSSAQAKIDVANLGYNLTSTNGLLTVTNLAKVSVDRLSGGIRAWSGLWTNQFALIFSNWVWTPDSNYFSPITNPIDCGIHCLILEARTMQSTQAVVVHAFNARSTNVVINDALTVGGPFTIDAESFTVNGQLVLTNIENILNDWHYTNAPSLTHFTNNGWISIPNVANYGGGYPGGRRWTRMVNTGTLEAVGHAIDCDEFMDSGNTSTRGSYSLSAGNAKFEGARLLTAGDTHIAVQDIKMHNATIISDRSLFLNVENSLSDSGGNANNQFNVQDGFHLVRKPQTGDLLGTTFTTTAPQFLSSAHTWAAENRGADRVGFQNNAAIGELELRVFPYSELRFGPPIDAQGNPAEGDFAMYVDYLDLDVTLQTDPENSGLLIEPGFTLYFAYANVPVESLDGKFDGRLRWVQNFAGPRSGIDVLVHSGAGGPKTIQVNKALLDSKLIDSDGDGLANLYDRWPFDGPTITSVRFQGTPPTQTLVSFGAAANTVYQIESASVLPTSEWTPVTTITNDAANARTLTVTDVFVNLAEGRERYYRVSYGP